MLIRTLFYQLLICSILAACSHPERYGTLGKNPNDPEAWRQSQDRSIKESKPGFKIEDIVVLPIVAMQTACGKIRCPRERTVQLRFVCLSPPEVQLRLPLRYKLIKIESLNPEVTSKEGTFPLILRTDSDGGIALPIITTSEDSKVAFKFSYGEESIEMSEINLDEAIAFGAKACARH